MPTYYSTSYAANSAVRVVLQELGSVFDIQKCGKQPLNTKKGRTEHKEEVLKFFSGKCCYCQRPFGDGLNAQREHLIPMNKDFSGLDCWKNVVYCCGSCNQLRARSQNLPLRKFLEDRKFRNPKAIEDRITSWQTKFDDDIKTRNKAMQSVQRLYDEITKDINKHLHELDLKEKK